MKKYLTILFMLICFGIFGNVEATAQTQWYRTTAYAHANVYNGNYVWGDWQSSDMNISINLTTDVITIYSPRTQIYRVYGVYNNGNVYSDNSGGHNLMFYVYDQDGDKGRVRLRVEQSGNSQIYVDFSNVAWVYNVRRTQ